MNPVLSEALVAEASLWPVYIIGMDRDSVRAQCAIDQMCKYNIAFEWFEAVDGTSLSKSKIEECFNRKRNSRIFKYPLSSPEIGCYLSHAAIWGKVARNDADGAFIFEDDFEASASLEPLLKSIMASASAADVISLHAPKRPLYRKLARLACGHTLVEPFIAPPRTTGYGITKQAAAKLTDSAIPFARPVDIDLKHWWEFGIRSLCVSPTALRIGSKAESSISDARRKARASNSSLTRFIHNFRYQVRYHSHLAWARLRIR